jgi:hypothetical protein
MTKAAQDPFPAGFSRYSAAEADEDDERVRSVVLQKLKTLRETLDRAHRELHHQAEVPDSLRRLRSDVDSLREDVNVTPTVIDPDAFAGSTQETKQATDRLLRVDAKVLSHLDEAHNEARGIFTGMLDVGDLDGVEDRLLAIREAVLEAQEAFQRRRQIVKEET